MAMYLVTATNFVQLCKFKNMTQGVWVQKYNNPLLFDTKFGRIVLDEKQNQSSK